MKQYKQWINKFKGEYKIVYIESCIDCQHYKITGRCGITNKKVNLTIPDWCTLKNKDK